MNKTIAKTNNDQTTNEPAINSSRPKIRLPYDYDDQKYYSQQTSINTGVLTPTLQSEAEACDVNYIVKRAEQTGVLASKNMNTQMPQYGDFSEVADYKEALNIVRDAEAQFASLPAQLRAEFNNDPAQFLAGLDNPKIQQKLVDLGLAEAPQKPEIANPPAAPAADPVKAPQAPPKGS